MTIEISDELYKRAAKIAADENIPVEDIVESAIENAVLETEGFNAKASRGNRSKFLAVMAKVPAVEPAEEDRPI